MIVHMRQRVRLVTGIGSVSCHINLLWALGSASSNNTYEITGAISGWHWVLRLVISYTR